MPGAFLAGADHEVSTCVIGPVRIRSDRAFARRVGPIWAARIFGRGANEGNWHPDGPGCKARSGIADDHDPGISIDRGGFVAWFGWRYCRFKIY